MNILFITPEPSLFGANRSLITLIEDLKNRYKINPVLLVSNKGNNKEYKNFKELCSRKGISVVYIKFYTWQCDCSIAKMKDVMKRQLNSILLKRVCFKLKKYQFDIVHTNTSVTHLGQLIADKYHVPHIWHVREFGKEDYNLRYIYNQSYVSKMYRRAKIVIAISDSIKQKIKEISPESNICLIYNGVSEGSRLLKKEIDRFCIEFCCVGRISEGKNQFEILEAVKILKKQRITDFKIYFIGSGDASYLNKMEQFIQYNDLQKNIEFLGYRNDVFKLLENMDVGIIASSMEAFGRVTVEYMLAQMPVIGADTGGTRELLKDTEFGFLYEHGRPESLAAHMAVLMKNPYMIRSLGTKAQKTAQELYSVKANTDKVYECYLAVFVVPK